MSRKKKKEKKTKVKNTIETKVERILKSLHLPYEPQAVVDKYTVDFLVDEKYVIECYGDFWHCNPSKYGPDFFNRGKKKTAKEIWDRDLCRKSKFEELGYEFLSLWESEINSNNKSVHQKIKKMTKQKIDGE